MSENHQNIHAVMIPLPLQGHIIPFVNLAMKLALKGFTITFINTQSNHHKISKAHTSTRAGGVHDIFAEARKSGMDIHYATVSDGFPVEFDRSLNHDQFMQSLLHVFSAHIDEVIGDLVDSDHHHPPTCLIADTFYVWTSMIANKYNLVNVSFWTEPALVLTLYYHLHLLRQNGHFGTNDNREDTIDYIPGVQAIEPKDLMSYLQDANIKTVSHHLIFKALADVKRADFIICNTVEELESDTISALQQEQPIYAIGPIFPKVFTETKVATSLWSESDCTQWLSTKPHGSVLYVSFGSYAHATKHDILEIAHGLVLSEVSFVWVLRPDIVSSDDTDFLPVGFEDDVKDRGLIVPWCHQISVISHLAIGGFLTHCGWNSVLESIWCSVPLICFPLLTDQFTNRKLVVDDWKIGINLCDTKPIRRKEVAQSINRLMSEKMSNAELRNEMKNVRKTLMNALTIGGSSEKNFKKFINDVKIKILEISNRGFK